MTTIQEFFTLYSSSAWNIDASAMINLYAADATIFDMWDQGYCPSQAEWNKSIVVWLGSLGDEKVKVEFDMVKITESGDTGFASALIRYSAISLDGTVLRSMRNRITVGFSKIAGQWKVVHQHTSAPIASKDLSAILGL